MQRVRLDSLATCLLFAAMGCSGLFLDFGSETESKALTYERYITDGDGAWFDPIGASDIYHRRVSTRDGFDAWWWFKISESNCDDLVVAVATKANGPTDIEWSTDAEPPPSWRPEGELPTWWVPHDSSGNKSIHWCYAAGSAERHHGWYFLYDFSSQTMQCWNWNHQWSSAQCSN